MLDKVIMMDVNSPNYNRLITPLANFFVENKIAKEVAISYDPFINASELDDSKYVSGVYKVKSSIEFNRIIKLKDKSKTVLMTQGYQISNLYWTYRYKKIGLKSYQYQHGMYAEFLKRDLLGYFSSIKKKIIYLKYLIYFIFRFNKGITLYLINKDFIKSLNINDKIKNNYKSSLKPLLSNHLFVWGEYWKKWFVDNHFYESTKDATVVGNPDYHTFIKDKELVRDENKVCYIAQSYVEDGRMKREDYKKVIDKLSNSFKDKLVVKLHPRSDLSMYSLVKDNGGELTKGFPMPSSFIGHYSSLLALPINEGAKVFILEMNNEETPIYYKESATLVTNNINKLVEAVKQNKIVDSSKNIAYYFKNLQEHPYEIISQRILVNGNL